MGLRLVAEETPVIVDAICASNPLAEILAACNDDLRDPLFQHKHGGFSGSTYLIL
jgi:hypothetical protein